MLKRGGYNVIILYVEVLVFCRLCGDFLLYCGVQSLTPMSPAKKAKGLV